MTPATPQEKEVPVILSSLIFSCCWKSAPLGCLLHGLPEFAGPLFLSVMPSCLPSLPLPASFFLQTVRPQVSSPESQGERNEYRFSDLNHCVQQCWSGKGGRQATGMPGSPFLLLPLSVLNRNRYISHDFPRRPQLLRKCRWYI